ncbi:Exportin-5, variant 3 [Balamuthia mandrillaris]
MEPSSSTATTLSQKLEDTGVRAIVALTHFCELHGPNLMFCTQMFSLSPSSSANASPSYDLLSSICAADGGSATPLLNLDKIWSSLGLVTASSSSSASVSPCASASSSPTSSPPLSSRSPSRSRSYSSSSSASSSSSSSSSSSASTSEIGNMTPGCPSCNCLPTDSGFLSFDSLTPATIASLQEKSSSKEDGEEAETKAAEAKDKHKQNSRTQQTHQPTTTTSSAGERIYVTLRYPAPLYSLLRTACVRSLSCEFCPGREGACCFGDEINGYALSYVFKLHDLQARGFVRWYSLLFIHPSMHAIAASWDIITSDFQHIIKELQERVEHTFVKEKNEREELDKAAGVNGGHRNASHLANNKASAKLSAAILNRNLLPSTSHFPSGPGAFRRRQVHNSAPLRGLADLYGDGMLYRRLHTYFSCTLRDWDQFLYTSPRLHASITLPPSQQTPRKFATLSMMNGGATGSAMVSHESTIQQQSKGEIDEDDGTIFRSSQQLFQAVGAKKMKAIIYNVATGNQLVVRGPNAALVTSILRLMKQLIPPQCCSVMEFEHEYHASWECNFLGLSSEAKIPDYIFQNSSFAYVVDIVPRSSASSPRTPLEEELAELSVTSVGSLLTKKHWTEYNYVCSGHASQDTTFARSILELLAQQLPNAVETKKVQAIRQEWIA